MVVGVEEGGSAMDRIRMVVGEWGLQRVWRADGRNAAVHRRDSTKTEADEMSECQPDRFKSQTCPSHTWLSSGAIGCGL